MSKIVVSNRTPAEWAKIMYTLAEIYDTYGCPADLIRVRLQEEGIDIDETLFNRMLKFAVKARQGRL